MIVDVIEYDFMGFHLELVRGKGWKVVLGDVEYLFPYAQTAESVIRDIHRDLANKSISMKLFNKEHKWVNL